MLPKSNEMKEQSIMFNESMRAFGFKAELLIPDSVNLPDLGYQQEVSYEDSEKFVGYVSINNHPEPKLLQTLGWNIENRSHKPIICYIARYLQRDYEIPRDVNTEVVEIFPQKYTRLTLEHDYEDKGREFIVSEVSSNSFNPIYYILMIVPYRVRDIDDSDRDKDSNFDLLDVDDSKSNFRFLGK